MGIFFYQFLVLFVKYLCNICVCNLYYTSLILMVNIYTKTIVKLYTTNFAASYLNI